MMNALRLRKGFFATLLFCLAAASLWAQDISYSGKLSALSGLGLPNTHDNKGEFLTGSLMFDNVFKAYLEESMFVFNAILIGDSLGSQSTNGLSAFVSDDGHFSLKLKEAYFDYNGGFIALRVGRQISAWGKADGIQIADVLCPQDESTVIASTYKESRQGIDAVRLSFIGESIQADAYWIPIFTPSTLPLASHNPLRKLVFPERLENVTLDTPSRYDDFDLPKKKIANSEYALRVGLYRPAFDLSFYGFYGWDDMPFHSYTGTSSVKVGGTYERMAMVGADAALPVGNFVFRLEGAWFPNRHTQTSADWQLAQQQDGKTASSSEKRHQLLGLVGFDWDPAGGWTITAQYIADYVAGSTSELDRKSYQHQASLSVEKKLLNETLTLSGQAFMDLRTLSTNSELSAEYSLTDAIKLSLIGNLFLEGPKEEGKYGSLHDLSCVTLKGTISF